MLGMPHHPRRFKITYCVMDVFDDAMFGMALQDAFPSMVMFPFSAIFPEPTLPLVDTFLESSSSSIQMLMPPLGWSPVFKPYVNLPGWYKLTNYPEFFFFYNGTEWDYFREDRDKTWVCDPPTSENGRIEFGPWTWTDEEKAFRSKVMRIFNKLTIDRYKEHDYTGAPLLMKDAPRRACRIGIHAMTWAQAAPRRMFEGRYRPCDDWEPKKSDWYLDLEDRVKAKYGPGFGDEPVERESR